MPPLFISFEGADGSGKSTQAARLSEHLRGDGQTVCETREPGGTAIGEEVRRIVKHVGGHDAVCDEAELLLFSASRAELVQKVIRPALDAGNDVVCDRFADSTVAYQGAARGMDMSMIARLQQFATGGRMPDLTFVLDAPIELLAERAQARQLEIPGIDRFDDESPAFHEAVRQAFQDIARNEPERVKIIDASKDVDHIHQDIVAIVNARRRS